MDSCHQGVHACETLKIELSTVNSFPKMDLNETCALQSSQKLGWVVRKDIFYQQIVVG